MRSGWPFSFISETDRSEGRVKSWPGHMLMDIGNPPTGLEVIPANEFEDRAMVCYGARVEGAGVAPLGMAFALYKSEWDGGAKGVVLPITARFDPVVNRWYSAQEIAGGEPGLLLIPAGYQLVLTFEAGAVNMMLRITWEGLTAEPGLLWPLSPRSPAAALLGGQ